MKGHMGVNFFSPLYAFKKKSEYLFIELSR